ncbi:hypothetical protein vseg_019682 [Gypsophila vaccaria]
MSPGLQRWLINLNANNIFARITTMFSQAPRILKYGTAVRFFEARLERSQSVSKHVLKMIEHVETLERLGNSISQEIDVDRVLHSLFGGFTQFRGN